MKNAKLKIKKEGVPKAHNYNSIAKRFIHFAFYIFNFSLMFGFPAFAVVGQAGTDIAILNAGVGARPLGMGGAFTAVADNADAPYWNPAGLGFLTSSEITTMQTRLATDADHYYLSYIQPALGGTIGISWIQVGMGTITQTSGEVDQHNEVINLNVFSYFSSAYLFAYGKEINQHLSLGITGKYLTSDMTQINGGQASGYSITPGILMKITERTTTRVVPTLMIGIKVDELVNSQQWGTGTVENVPPKLRLGLAYLEPKVNSLFSLDISQTIRSNYSPEIAAGYEWKSDGLSLRAGYTDGLTFGAGFTAGIVTLDYAYVQQKALSTSNVQRISLSGKW
jgi:hypothetical protein